MTEYDLYILCDARCKVHNPAGYVETELFNSFTAAARSKISLEDGIYYELEMDLPSRSKISSELFNFTQWYLKNIERAIPFYGCTIYDQKTGQLLLELPMKSFQGRMRLETPDYIAAVIAGSDNFTAIDTYAQAGAFMAINKAIYIDGQFSLSEEIARVVLERPRMDKGASSESMTLYGYRQSAQSSKTVNLSQPKIVRVINGGLQMVFSEPDLYLRAGDTAVVDGYAPFTISTISYSVNAEGNTLMNIAQEVTL